jgi:hypothetical protein
MNMPPGIKSIQSYFINNNKILIIGEDHNKSNDKITNCIITLAKEINPSEILNTEYCQKIGSVNIQNIYKQSKLLNKFKDIQGYDIRGLLLKDCNRDFLYHGKKFIYIITEKEIYNIYLKPILNNDQLFSILNDKYIIKYPQAEFLNKYIKNIQQKAKEIVTQLKSWNKNDQIKNIILTQIKILWADLVDGNIIKHIFKSTKNSIILCGDRHSEHLEDILRQFE